MSDCFLDLIDIRHLPLIALSPKQCLLLYVDQFKSDYEIVSNLANPSRKQCSRAQPSSNLPRVHILTLKAEDAAAGNYSESWQLRESVDNALSKAVRKILGVSVVGLVNERQDGNGVNRLGHCYSSEMLCTWVSMYILMTSKARM